MTLVKVKMHLEGLNGWNEIVKPKKLKVIVWQRKLESHLTFFSKPNKTCNYQYCKWWLYIISNQPQQPAVQINLILATHFGDGTDLRRSPQGVTDICTLQLYEERSKLTVFFFGSNTSLATEQPLNLIWKGFSIVPDKSRPTWMSLSRLKLVLV